MAKQRAGVVAKARVQRHLHQATVAWQSGRLGDCERYCRRVLNSVSTQPQASHLLAMVCARTGRLQMAMDLARKAVSKAPTDAVFSNTLANLLYESGNVSAAEQQWQQTLAIDPQQLNALYNLGLAQLLLGHQRAAKTTLTKAAVLAPDDAEVQVRYARALAADGELDAAIRVGTRALQLAPRAAELWNEVGRIHAGGGSFEPAKAHYRTALKLTPDCASAALNLSKAQRFSSSGDPAVDADMALIHQAWRLIGHHGRWQEQRDIRYALGKLCDDCGDTEAAVTHYCAANELHRYHSGGTVDGDHNAVKAVRQHFTGSLFQRLSSLGCHDPTPIFIVGLPRSGTSLVEQILAAHPQVHGGGELQLLDQIAHQIPQRYACEQPYPGCMSALPATDYAAIGNDYVSRLRSHTETNSVFITDKMPANYLHLGLIALCLPAARIVWCEREALDNGLSLFFTNFAIGHLYTTDWAAIEMMLGAVKELGEYWTKILPILIFKVEYEVLVRNPEPYIRELLKYCDLEWHPNCGQPHRVRRDVNTSSSWQVRQPIYTHAVSRFQRYQKHLTQLLGTSKNIA